MVNRLSMTIQETLRDNKAVLLEAINLIREFNKEMHKIGETVEDAKNSCKDLLFCLFLINRNKVYSVPMIACCNIRMQSHFKGLEKQYLANEHSVIWEPIQVSTQQDIQTPLEVITNSSSITHDYLDKLTQIQDSSNDKQNKSFKKIAKNTKTWFW